MLARRAERARRLGLLVPLALALLLHAALLDGLVPEPPGAAPGRPPALQVRRIAAPSPAPVEPAPVAQVAAPAPPPPRVPPPAAPAIRRPVPIEALPLAALQPAASAVVSPAGGQPPPLYRAVLAPPVTLDYELRRGRLAGSGTLVWRPQGGRYTLQLDGSIAGLRVLVQASQGGIDTNGLAPERFTDQRARRPMQAANLRRELGRISFSGPSHELPLWPGVQDRLSWMLQLAAIAAAEPARWTAGEQLVLQVVGARGDVGTWAFDVLGEQRLETPGGPVSALHLQREPRGAYETAVEVWLDPARHHLPVRATLRSGEDDALELRLRHLVTGG